MIRIGLLGYLNGARTRSHLLAMSSPLLILSAVISGISSVGHSQLGFEVAPALQTLSALPRHAGQNGWWQISGYFILNGTDFWARLNVAIQQARWAKYGIVSGYDKVMFWGLCGLYMTAGLGYASAGIVLPATSFLANVACMLASRLLA